MVTIPTHQPYPKLESLTCIDISKLSQSELHSLSLCSDSAFDPLRSDDLIIPQINRSIFHESAGTRKQTYSRLRRGPPSASGHPRPRLPGSTILHPSSTTLDLENKSIITSLKLLLGLKPEPNPNPNPNGQLFMVSDCTKGVCENGLGDVFATKKRERGRKPKLLENGVGMELEIANRNGAAVDLEALGKADELYGVELGRRTVGLRSEEEVLGFLKGLEGEWGSRRKKRKIVDASEFGDALPIGWKILLGLRRREGHVSVYCRRYMSPTGQQFVSCKDAASFLQSHFGLNDADQPMDQRTASIQLAYKVASRSHAGFIHKADDIRHNMISDSTLASSSLSVTHEKEVSLAGIDDLAEVQVWDLFDCYKCNMTFDEKNEYLQHLLSFHQKTTRRYRLGLGTSVGEGVIIKDGKYECQFCHKIFQERRSYNGHVGVHVRNHVRGSKELPTPILVQNDIESPSKNGLPPRISKMGALIEIAQNSILETSSAGRNDKPRDDSSPDKLNVDQKSAAHTDHELNLVSNPSEVEMEDYMAAKTLNQGLNQNDLKYVITDGVKIDDTWDVENVNMVYTNNSEHPKFDEVEEYGNIEVDIGLKDSHVEPNYDIVKDSVRQNVQQNGVPDSSASLVQSSLCFPAFTAVSNEVHNVSGFEELRLNEIVSFKYGFENGKESPSLPAVSMDLANEAGMEEGFNSSVRFESEAVVFNVDVRHQLTTLCVWCRTEFNHEAIDSEILSDSIGFMCPTCKAKISGHMNCGFSMNARGF